MPPGARDVATSNIAIVPAQEALFADTRPSAAQLIGGSRFSQPRSASGESDVVANLDDEDRLVCETKLYDGDRYGKAYVAKGVQ